MLVLADNFLAGAIISLLVPAGLLVVVITWYWYAVRRVPDGRSGRQARRDATTQAPPSTPQPGAGPQPGAST